MRNKEVLESNIGVIDQVKALVKIALNNPKLFFNICTLNSECNNSYLSKGVGPYYNYILNGQRLPIPTLESDIKAGRIIDFDSKDAEIQELLFANAYVLRMLNASNLEFDANSGIRTNLHEISKQLISQIEFKNDSLVNLSRALKLSKDQNKKIVFIANHISHLDAPILDYILSNRLDINSRIPRFICGAFMYYNRGVRPYTIGFNTLFVYGPKDFSKLISRVPSSDRGEIKKINEKVLDRIKDKSQQEVSVLFPYAGRSKKGEDELYKIGCKDKIIRGMKDMLSIEDCIYIPLGFIGTDYMFSSEGHGGGGNMLKNFANAKACRVSISIGKHFFGGEKTLDEINGIMHSTSSNAFENYNP